MISLWSTVDSKSSQRFKNTAFCKDHIHLFKAQFAPNRPLVSEASRQILPANNSDVVVNQNDIGSVTSHLGPFSLHSASSQHAATMITKTILCATQKWREWSKEDKKWREGSRHFRTLKFVSGRSEAHHDSASPRHQMCWLCEGAGWNRSMCHQRASGDESLSNSGYLGRSITASLAVMTNSSYIEVLSLQS